MRNREKSATGSTTPMTAMFGERPAPEKSSTVPASRPRKSSHVCNVCRQSFSSAIVLRVHQSSAHSTHTTSNEPITRPKRRTIHSKNSTYPTALPNPQRPQSTPQQQPQTSVVTTNRVAEEQATTSTSSTTTTSTTATVAAVKALIALAKDGRQKRGSYRRYTPEIRDAIAQHAIHMGTHDAVRTFTSSLGNCDIGFKLASCLKVRVNNDEIALWWLFHRLDIEFML